LFAYSSIANVGFLLIGPSTVSLDGLNAALIYLIFYSLILVSLFYLFISVKYTHNKLKMKNINELFGFLTNNSLICMFLLLNLFSLIGIPPLAGFFWEILFIYCFFCLIFRNSFCCKFVRKYYFSCCIFTVNKDYFFS